MTEELRKKEKTLLSNYPVLRSIQKCSMIALNSSFIVFHYFSFIVDVSTCIALCDWSISLLLFPNPGSKRSHICARYLDRLRHVYHVRHSFKFMYRSHRR